MNAVPDDEREYWDQFEWPDYGSGLKPCHEIPCPGAPEPIRYEDVELINVDQVMK